MDTKQVVARFEAERQALAVMDHPNIARVFDAGASEAGRPYFAMELVRGTPLNEYCDTHKPSTEGRIELHLWVVPGGPGSVRRGRESAPRGAQADRGRAGCGPPASGQHEGETRRALRGMGEARPAAEYR
jgi:hypothetical protein